MRVLRARAKKRKTSRARGYPLPRTVLGRGHPAGDFLEAHEWLVLEPRAGLCRVERVGLEDAGDLVALASDEQLLDLFDASLWKSEQVGGDEHFDPVRFATWLEAVETGEDAAARRFIEMPEELLALALHSQMLVLDSDALFAISHARAAASRSSVESALEASLTFELDRYLLVSRRPGRVGRAR